MEKKYLKNFLFVIIPTIIIFIICSCNKTEKEQRIIGIWKKVNIPFPNDSTIVEWHFTYNKIYVVNKKKSLTDNSVRADTTEKAIYQLKVGLSKTTITTSGFSYDALNTKWNVIEYTDDVLAIHGYKDRNFQYLEFTKIR